mmetsp:Transcript_441/g.582  ORF Transcript_441/g.582 Transcript_441/m.582 type:complete len:370 (-) Transcript_441:84-1193(-)
MSVNELFILGAECQEDSLQLSNNEISIITIKLDEPKIEKETKNKTPSKAVVRYCTHHGCSRRAFYKRKGSKIATHCWQHKHSEMVESGNIKCEQPTCFKRPAFNFEGVKRGAFCKDHKLDGMVDVLSFKCVYPGCRKQPYCNYQGEKKGLYCRIHKLDNMLDVVNRRCEFAGCMKRPVYRHQDEKSDRFCPTHRLPDMISSVAKYKRERRCEFPGCSKSPTHNYLVEKGARFCGQHKTPEMVMKTLTCKHMGCETFPSYNYAGTKQRAYCAKHKLQGMINVCFQRCDFPECTNQARFRGAQQAEGEMERKFCSKHRYDDAGKSELDSVKSKTQGDENIKTWTRKVTSKKRQKVKKGKIVYKNKGYLIYI